MFQLLIAELLFLSKSKHRKNFSLRISLFFVLAILGYDFATIYAHLQNAIILSIGLSLGFIITLFGFYLSFDCEFQEILFCCVAAYAVQNFGHNLLVGFQDHNQIIDNSLPSLAIALATFTVVYSLAYTVYLKLIKAYKIKGISRLRNLSSCIVALLLTTFYPILFSNRSDNNILLLLYALTSDILVLCIQFDLLNESKLKNQNEMMEQILLAGQRQYQLSKENIELINLKCHDLKHQIMALRSIKNESIKEEAISEIERSVQMYDNNIKTGNDTLDVLLREKSLYAKTYRIKLSCITDGAKLDFIKPYDIYSLFGNILDNAIESVSKEEDEEKRIISIYVGGKHKMLSLHFENYYCGSLIFENGLPKTTKRDSDFHGYGILSVRHIVKKYNGNIVVAHEENIFSVNILIPIP
jgi:hypothetical protein